MASNEHEGVKKVSMSLHMIVRRNLPSESSTWPQNKIVEALSKLTHLRLDRENISEIDHMELFSDHLTNIYLQHNEIEHIDNLEFVRGVQFLTLASNRLRRVEGLKQLHRLVFLDIIDNYIHDIDTDELPKSLSSMNLKGNPCAKNPDLRRHLVALPRLRQLDGVVVTEAEKRAAGVDVSSSEEDSEEDSEEEEDLQSADVFSTMTSDILLRSQARLEDSLVDHRERKEVLRTLRSAAGDVPQPGT